MEKEVIDSIAQAHVIVAQVCHSSLPSNGLEVIYKISMILIASTNMFFAWYIYRSKNKKDDHIHEKNRKIGLVKTLILDYNMKDLYVFFENLDKEIKALQNKNLTNDEKKVINDKIVDFGKDLRQRFIDVLIAIDRKLYNEVLSLSDILIDNLTETIFDEGINLSHQPMYSQKISTPITETKTSIIKALFSYKGD